MGRALGQIDQRKAEAVLDAAARVFAQYGPGASVDQVAAEAGVSKQTIYNRYGSKGGLVRALVERRVGELVAPLEAPGAADHPERALAALAHTLLSAHAGASSPAQLMRVVVQHAAEEPETARLVWEAGPRTSRRRLAAFLEAETRLGRLAVDDPDQAAEFFLGMVIGQLLLQGMLAGPARFDEETIRARAEAAAERFVRAYSP